MFFTKFDNNCIVCGVRVKKEKGFCYRNGLKWDVLCTGIECIKEACPGELSKYKKLMKKLEQREENSSVNKEHFLDRAKKSGAYPYQIEAIDWLINDGNKLLADDMGLGKSLISLMSLDENMGTIIVCPSHLKLNWRDETKKWRPDLKITIMEDGKYFKYPEAGEVFILTYGLLPWWLELPPKKRKNPMVESEEIEVCKNIAIVFDECHALKNNKSKQSRKARFLAKMCKKVIGLTGTPILNHPMELWNICYTLGIHEVIFDDFNHFCRLFNGRRGKYGLEFEKLPKDNVWEYLSRAIMRRTKEEVNLQLPKVIVKEISAEQTIKQTKQFDSSWNMFKKSRYFDTGELPPIEEMSKEKKALAKSKIPTLKNVVDNLIQQDVAPIVFTAHQDPIIALSKMKGWGKIDGFMTSRQKHKVAQQYQNGELKGLVCSIKAAGTGFTLTRGSVVVFNDLDWTPGNNNQAMNRINRIGQKAEQIVYYYIVADHPLDRHIHKLILDKMALFAKTLGNKESYKVDTEKSLNETKEEQEKRKEEVIRNKEEEIRVAIMENLPRWEKLYSKIEPQKGIKKRILQNIDDKDDRENRILRLLLFSGLKTKKEKMLAESVLQKKLGEKP